MKEWPEEDDHLTFAGGEGGMGDLRKKNPADWFRGKKFLQGNTSRKRLLNWKRISFMAYEAGKNSYAVVCQ